MTDPTSGAAGNPGGQNQPVFKYDPSQPHLVRPKLRAVRGFGAQREGQQLLGLSDARQISDKVVFTAPAAQFILPHLDGANDLDTVVNKVNEQVASMAAQQGAKVQGKLERSFLELFVAQLDDAGLLEGPSFEAMLVKVREQFDSSKTLPPSVTANFADVLAMQELGQDASESAKAEIGATKMREQFDLWIAEAFKSVDNPSFDHLPAAVIAPHLDYGRGWMNYAHVYGRMRVVDKPDRVIILGTNHFGMGTGVVGCDKGFETPLGVTPLADDVLAALRRRLGEDGERRLLKDKYDHEREHSIELQVAWVQHVFGPPVGDVEGKQVPVFAALVHDPARNSGQSYDGYGLDFDPFVEALRATIEELPGRTLVIASADLSHVGPMFGDRTPLHGDEATNPQGIAARNSAIQHDQAMLKLVSEAKPDELIASMAWQGNPTRWCSIGNMAAAMKVVGATPERTKMLNYLAAMDQQGMGMVSCMAAAVV
ncbi:MAG: AmmeMemoRadiSam system protein B [Phycisphaeraceae bacterium]|nr:AmmeMemoRadiSam system protein B [Phycisphaeraceae bacterium]